MVRIKTVTIHFDYETWEDYNKVKTDAGMTWTEIMADWFKRYEQEAIK